MKLMQTTTIQAIDDRGVSIAAVSQTIEHEVGVYPPKPQHVSSALDRLLANAGEAIKPATLAAITDQQEVS